MSSPCARQRWDLGEMELRLPGGIAASPGRAVLGVCLGWVEDGGSKATFWGGEGEGKKLSPG